ncbi:MAG: PilZ domain-containing protein [Oscillospiraceae bacterium]
MRTTEIEYIGKSCELKSLMNDLLSVGTIVGMDDVEGTMDIAPQGGGFLATLPYNMPVKLVLNLPKVGFRLMLGRVYLSSGQRLRLVDIGTHQTTERRQFFRLNINITGLVTFINDNIEEIDKEPETLEVEIKDVSLGGVRMATRRIFVPNEEFSLTYTLIKYKAEMMCRVCREIYMDSQRPGIHQYGCQFINVTDKMMDKLCGDLFEMQRVQVRKKKDNSL